MGASELIDGRMPARGVLLYSPEIHMTTVPSPSMRVLMVILVVAVLSACSGLGPIGTADDLMAINGENISSFNGTYAIVSSTGSYRTLSYGLLLDDGHGPYDTPDSVRVKIGMVDPKRMQVSLLSGEHELMRRSLKGSLKENHFVLRRRLIFKPKWVIINFVGDNKARIALFPNGDLKLDVAGGGCGTILFFPLLCADDRLYGLRFPREQ